jgi:hypothetical protein
MIDKETKNELKLQLSLGIVCVGAVAIVLKIILWIFGAGHA